MYRLLFLHLLRLQKTIILVAAVQVVVHVQPAVVGAEVAPITIFPIIICRRQMAVPLVTRFTQQQAIRLKLK
ncbi:hypothetical protein ASE28_12005 [Acidovorax sp. Root219]|nr:hypothetical protein ASE28_12005 [Acidovorax sp. Root219]